MLYTRATSLIVVFLCAIYPYSRLIAQVSTPLVYLENERLVYTPFAMQGQTNEVNTLPDFSYAGYSKGGIPLPKLPVILTLTPQTGDNRAAIQAAIDEVAALTPDANGFRGAVLLKKGLYEVRGSLRIETSGVVLRGEGQGPDGTVLFASLPENHDFILVQGQGNGIQEDPSSAVRIRSPYVPVGSHRFQVDHVEGFEVGDLISIKRTPNQRWIDTLQMAQYGWTPSSYAIRHERVITGIAGDTLTIDLPIVDVMEELYGGGTVSKASVPGRITNCGVENLRVRSIYASSTDEAHVWKAVRLRRSINSWVKGVTAQYCGYACVSIEAESNFNTVEECANIDQISRIAGARRYSFNISDGVGNLFQRCYTSDGRHDFVTGSRVTGPNVFLDSYSRNTYSDIGPHHRWATGILFDNIKGGQIRVQNRGASGTGHGWAGAQVMFWNLQSNQDIKVESPLGSRNWGIGCIGSSQVGAGYWDNWGTHVLPRSLYLQQLEDRLGIEAVEQITLPQQRNGAIYSLLGTWAGNGPLIDPLREKRMRISASEDTYVAAGVNANNNYGEEQTLSVSLSSNVNGIVESYLKFDLAELQQGFQKASLRLFVHDGGSIPHKLYFVSDDSWSEASLTWLNKPVLDAEIELVITPSSGLWLEVDISDLVSQEIKGDGILSVGIQANLSNFPTRYRSSEYPDASFHPEIAITPSRDTLFIAPLEDTYIQAGAFADMNFGSNEALEVQRATPADSMRAAFLKFDLSAFKGNLLDAKLQLKVKQNPAARPLHSLWYVKDDAWTEHDLTWNNQPGNADSLLAAAAPLNDHWIEFDITQQVQTELTIDSLLSFMIRATTPKQGVRYFSQNAAAPANRPRLLLSFFSENSFTTDITPATQPPDRPTIKPYPNPFSQQTQIELRLAKSGKVRLHIRDLNGRIIRTLHDKALPSGVHRLRWDGQDTQGNAVPGGIYLLQLMSDHAQVVQRILLMR